MVSGLVPPEVLSILQAESAVQFDVEIAWYAAGVPDVHGEYSYPDTPQYVPARVVERMEELYDAQGNQAISTQSIYLPLGTAVGMHDKLLPSASATAPWPPILEITNIPTTGEPVMLRVRTGQI